MTISRYFFLTFVRKKDEEREEGSSQESESGVSGRKCTAVIPSGMPAFWLVCVPAGMHASCFCLPSAKMRVVRFSFGCCKGIY